LAAINVFAGGIALVAGPVRFASSGLFRPLAAAAVLLAAVAWVGGAAEIHRDRPPGDRRQFAVACAAVTLLVGLVFKTGVAGGADSYGYVSQAYLWAQGTLHVEEPLAASPLVGRAAAPLA